MEAIEEKGKKYIICPLNRYVRSVSILKEINEEVVCKYKGRDETCYRFNEEDINIKIRIEGCNGLYLGVALEPNDRVGIYWGIVLINEEDSKEKYKILVPLMNNIFKENVIEEKESSNWIWTQKEVI